jgi:hypothetical protein
MIAPLGTPVATGESIFSTGRPFPPNRPFRQRSSGYFCSHAREQTDRLFAQRLGGTTTVDDKRAPATSGKSWRALVSISDSGKLIERGICPSSNASFCMTLTSKRDGSFSRAKISSLVMV